MPTYEYVCLECQNKFDVYAALAEKEKGLKPECPNCHSQKTVQVFGNVSFIGGSRGGVNPCSGSSTSGCCST